MTTYYISGPMRGIPEFNYPTFLEVEEALANGFENTFDCVLNPARSFNGATDRDVNEYMQIDMEMVLSSDVVVLLPGWEQSEGANREVQLATWTGKRFMLAIPVKTFVDEGVPTRWAFNEIDVPTKNVSPRESALTEATQLITGDRNSQYGPPTEDFRRTAAMASGFGFRVVQHEGGEARPLDAHHVAIFMMLLKTSRLAWSPAKRDSWVDSAGYSGCGYECAVEEDAARRGDETADSWFANERDAYAALLDKLQVGSVSAHAQQLAAGGSD